MSQTDVPNTVRERVRNDAGNRCGYCLGRQKYVLGILEIEHITPRAKGGSDDESNLWLSCSLCNRFKAARTEGIDPATRLAAPLFNPRTQPWEDHFQWSADGVRILGKTPIGRATVETLRLNNDLSVEVRRNWVLAGWHPPQE